MSLSAIVRTVLRLSLLAALAVATLAHAAPPGPVKTIVLVHGAWADGSSWSKVIPLLQAKGFTVVAVQNPVLGLAEDVAAVKRALSVAEGPVLLVGHSWGGVVITDAGADPKVVGLVYLATPPLDVGQTLGTIGQGHPTPPGPANLRPAGEGFLALTPEGVSKHFALDLPPAEARLVWATQGATAARIFTDSPSVAAWKEKRSWAIVTRRDHMFDPGLLAERAKAIHAETVTLDASHVAMLSQPRAVADVILRAARGGP